MFTYLASSGSYLIYKSIYKSNLLSRPRVDNLHFLLNFIIRLIFHSLAQLSMLDWILFLNRIWFIIKKTCLINYNKFKLFFNAENLLIKSWAWAWVDIFVLKNLSFNFRGKIDQSVLRKRFWSFALGNSIKVVKIVLLGSWPVVGVLLKSNIAWAKGFLTLIPVNDGFKFSWNGANR